MLENETKPILKFNAEGINHADKYINAKKASLGGKVKGNISCDKINIKKTAEIEGVLNQKTLSIEEGAFLKIKTETYK